MPKLNMQRVVQEKRGRGQCAIAASTCIAQYHNPEITYTLAKRAVKKIHNRSLTSGLDSGETGQLLNLLGFQKVSLILSDLDIVDMSWSRLSKKNKIKKLKQWKQKNKLHCTFINCILNFLEETKYENNLIIDWQFDKYIKQYLSQDFPVLLSYNWTQFFKLPRGTDRNEFHDVKGEYELHTVCCNGFSKTGVYVIDSHNECYKYRLKRYREGKYHVKWTDLLSCMGLFGDMYLAENYDPDKVDL
jgi:hypothetical protein